MTYKCDNIVQIYQTNNSKCFFQVEITNTCSEQYNNDNNHNNINNNNDIYYY